MTQIKLKYIVEDVDRHGNVRRYFRRPGARKIRLRGAPGSPEFMAAYLAALNDDRQGRSSSTAPQHRRERGSLDWLCAEFYGSVEFAALAEETQSVYRRYLNAICDQSVSRDNPQRIGGLFFASMTADAVRRLRDRKAKTPGSARTLLTALRAVFSFAVERGLATLNPAKSVPRMRMVTTGWHTWTLAEVARFEARHAVGSKARLALALLLYTGQRRSDIVRLGPEHLENGWLKFTQAKNQKRKPVTLELPVLPELAAILDASRLGTRAFLETGQGAPFTPAGFGNKFREWCNEAGLPQCSAHGLRKAGACIAAENGATERQLCAIFGWQNSKQAALYTKKADQRRLAGESMHLLSRPPVR